MTLELPSYDTDPYSGFDIPDPIDLPPAPEKRGEKDTKVSLDSLADTSAARLDMTKESLKARADIIKAASKDPAFPVSMKFGYQSQNSLSTLGWAQYASELSPAFADGEHKLSIAIRSATESSEALKKINAQIVPLENQLETLSKQKKTLDDGYALIINSYTTRTGNELSADYLTAIDANLISLDPGTSEWITNSKDPKIQEIVKTLNAANKYYTDHSAEFSEVNNQINEVKKKLSSVDALYSQRFRTEAALERDNKNTETAIKNRFLYLRGSLDSQLAWNVSAFQDIFHEKYDAQRVRNHVTNALNAYGENLLAITSLPTDSSSAASNERYVRENIMRIWSELSKEEKLIFLNILGSELNRFTYNQETAQTGKTLPVPTLGKQFSNLAQATYSEQSLPLSVCTGIHATVAQVANAWGIDAGVVTVGGQDLGHAITVMKVADKTVFSDYWVLYTGRNIEEALDTYAVKNKNYVFTNYLANDKGDIIGAIQTPLNREVNAQMFTMRDVESWLKKPSNMPEGVEFELTNRGKRMAFNKHVGGTYAGIGYKENEIAGLKLQTIHTTLGYEAGNELLRGFGEVNVSKTRIGSEKDMSRDYYAAAAQAGVSKIWPVNDAFSIETGMTAKAKIQLADHLDLSVHGLTKGQVGEVVASGNVQAKYALDPKTTLHAGVMHTRNVVLNLQSGATDTPNTYGSNTVYGGITHKDDEKGSAFDLAVSREVSALANTSKAQATLRNMNMSASAYAEIIRSTGKSPLGPSDSSRVGLEVTKKLGEWKDTRIDAFAGVRQDRIDGKSNGPVYNAGIKGTF